MKPKMDDPKGSTHMDTATLLDRRGLVKKLAKAAALPLVVAAFVASDVTDAAAS